MQKQEVILVYNASTGVKQKLMDAAHKIISPQTYACHLCLLTHHSIGERTTWKKFKEQFKIEFKIWYKEDFLLHTTNLKIKLPAVLLLNNGAYKQIFSSEEIKKMHSVEDLIKQIIERIS